MNSKIAMSAISIMASLAVMGGATFAFFSSSAESTDNIFTAGDLVLLVDDIDDVSAASIVASITGDDMAPGDTTSGFISLDNDGSMDIEKVKMAISAIPTDGDTDASDMRDVLELTVVVDDATPDDACVGGTDVTSTIDTEVGNGGGPLLVKEFNDGGDDEFDSFFEGLPVLASGTTTNVCFTATFSSSAGDIYQGDSVNATFTFTGLQDESQI